MIILLAAAVIFLSAIYWQHEDEKRYRDTDIFIDTHDIDNM